jgi:hypothetical protein
MLAFDKSKCSISSGPTLVRGTVDFNEGIIPQAKWHLLEGEQEP